MVRPSRWHPCVFALVVFLSAPPAHAQAADDLPRVELFGGYSYLPNLDEYAEVKPAHGWAIGLTVNFRRHFGVVIDLDSHTWTDPGSLTSVDFSQLQCPLDAYGCLFRGDEGHSLRYFSIGPRAHIQKGRLTIFGLAAFEVQRTRYSEQDLARVGRADDLEFVARVSIKPQNYSYTRPYVFNTWDRPLERHGDNVVARARLAGSTAGAWGFGIGGGADVSLGELVGVRLVQINYSFGGYGEGPGRKLRIKTGIVFKFG